MGLAWTDQCWCDNTFGAQGEAPATDCDSTGTVADPPLGIADLYANNEGNCGYRNAVYSTTRECNCGCRCGATLAAGLAGADGRVNVSAAC